MLVYGLFLVYFLVGCFYWHRATKNAAVYISVLSIAAIPSGSIFVSHVMASGVSVFFGVLFGIVSCGLLVSLRDMRLDRRFLIPIIVGGCLSLFFIIHFQPGINLLRDARAFIMLAIALVAALFLRRLIRQECAAGYFKIFKLSVVVAFVKTIALWVMVKFYNLNTKLSEDPMHLHGERMSQWYSDLGLFIGIAWLLCFSRKYTLVDVMAFIIIFASGNRTILVAMLIIYIARMNLSFRNIAIAVVVLALAGLTLSERLMSADLSILTSFLIRFSPFFTSVENMPDMNILIGYGFGYGFEIPWFEYRGLDTSLNFLDSFYLTVVAKFGLLAIPVVFLLYKVYSISLQPNKGMTWYFVLMGITTSLVYQTSFPIVIFLFALGNYVSLGLPGAFDNGVVSKRQR